MSWASHSGALRGTVALEELGTGDPVDRVRTRVRRKGADSVLKTPDLMVAAAYDPEDFDRFMRTGKAAGNRELPMMSGVARDRFALFTSQENAALHEYLKARVNRVMANADTSTLPKR